MKSFRCAYCDRTFELSDNAIPHKYAKNGEPVCERCILEME